MICSLLGRCAPGVEPVGVTLYIIWNNMDVILRHRPWTLGVYRDVIQIEIMCTRLLVKYNLLFYSTSLSMSSDVILDYRNSVDMFISLISPWFGMRFFSVIAAVSSS